MLTHADLQFSILIVSKYSQQRIASKKPQNRPCHYIYRLTQSGRRATVINKSLFAIDLGEVDRWYFILPRIWSTWLASLFLGINANWIVCSPCSDRDPWAVFMGVGPSIGFMDRPVIIWGWDQCKYRFYGPNQTLHLLNGEYRKRSITIQGLHILINTCWINLFNSWKGLGIVNPDFIYLIFARFCFVLLVLFIMSQISSTLDKDANRKKCTYRYRLPVMHVCIYQYTYCTPGTYLTAVVLLAQLQREIASRTNAV